MVPFSSRSSTPRAQLIMSSRLREDDVAMRAVVDGRISREGRAVWSCDERDVASESGIASLARVMGRGGRG